MSKTKLQITIRKYVEDDYQFIHNLHRENMISYINEYWGAWNSGIFRKDVCSDKIWIIDYKSKRVGFFVLEFEEKAYLRNVQICSSYQNKGIGSQVLQHGEHECIKENFDYLYLYLDVFIDNPAKNLYDRLGYEIYKKTKSHYLMKKLLRK